MLFKPSKPFNLKSKDQNLFDKYDGYNIPSYQVKRYHNIFLTRNGIGLSKLRLIKNTIHQYARFIKLFQIIGLYNLILRKKININEEIALIHNPWCFGYYHWLVEALPRLIMVNNYSDSKTVKVVLPTEFKGSFQTETLKMFENLQIIFINPKTNVYAKEAIIPDNVLRTGIINSESIKKLKDKAINYGVKNNLFNLSLGEKIFVERKTNNRNITNRIEFYELLKEYGYKILSFEEYSFWQQVSIMSNVNSFISVHGAGLTNMLFQKSGNVIEIQLQPKKIPDYSPLYYYLASQIGLYYGYFFAPAENNKSNIYDANLTVNISEFRELLENI